jgi:hypothetical protein
MAGYPGTNFFGCGDCHGGDWHLCSCCVTSWIVDNLFGCCDPMNPNKDSVACDPNWCPFSTACEKADSTATHCAKCADEIHEVHRDSAISAI